MKNFWQKNKKRICKTVGWYLVSLFFIFIIPICINWIHKTPAFIPFLNMDWEAKDSLSFYGSLLGAAATIFVLTSTIKFTVNSQKDERKLAIKPRLDSKWKDYTNNLLTLSENENFLFIDYAQGSITSSEKFPPELSEISILFDRYQRDNSVVKREIGRFDKILSISSFEKKYAEFTSHNLLILYEIYNYGANNAIEVDFEINGDVCCIPFCISTNEPKRIIIILHDDLLIENHKHINISIKYTDICSLGKYEQKESFIVTKNNSQFSTIQAFECKLSSPKEI